MNSCPRCRASAADCREETRGFEDGDLIWTVWHCTRCAFTWRDSEPERSIDYSVREQFFRVDPESPDNYPYNIPPAGGRR